jgi:hypothetical protein
VLETSKATAKNFRREIAISPFNKLNLMLLFTSNNLKSNSQHIIFCLIKEVAIAVNENEKAGDMKEMQRRLQFLEMASIVNTIMEKRYYSKLVGSLEQDDPAKFEALCETAKIPKAMRNELWSLLKKSWTSETPWMSGTTPRLT